MNNKERIIELESKLKNDIKMQGSDNLTVHYQIQKPDFQHIDELQTNDKKQVSLHIRATVKKDGKKVKDESGVILSAKLHLATKKPVSKKEAFEMFGTELYQPEIMQLKDNHFNTLQDYCQVAAYKNNIRKEREVQKGRDKVELQHGITTHSLAAPIHHVCEQIGEIESVDRVTAFEAESLLQAIFRLEEILRAKGMDEKALQKPLSDFSMLNDTIASQVHEKYQVANKSKKNQIEADIFGDLTDEEVLNIEDMTHKDHSYPRQELEKRKKKILATSPQAVS
ncbi:hypothetical protein OAE_16120 [Vibrio cyclitrophicus 1F289]|uniref:hypothetical protein n=1 Tax=Vibrio cyclitrophicus TaxID=47951 RepID=UPI0002D882AF|nr:hypothetical protein [Vibrio cyclitrophicus]OEF42389.1 hypothetical protein OAE_16120 [Vibrio cyclitrophicus 1F289]